MRKIISILLKVVAGFSLYFVMGGMFAEAPSIAFKLGMLAVFGAPAVVCLLVDMLLTRFRQWKWDLGIVFLSSGACTLICVVTVFFLLMTPAAQRQMQPGTLEKINDYIPGITLIFLLEGLGGLLLVAN